MGDRAPVHITIGGTLPREHLATFAGHAADYDLRTEWDGEPFDPAVLPEGEPLELYGTELNGGLIDDIDAFCVEHRLTFRRWSGGCLGAFLPEIIVHDGTGKGRVYSASEDEYVVFSPTDIKPFKRLRDLKRAIARAGQHDGTDAVVVVAAVHRIAQLVCHDRAPRVHRIGAIERDRGHALGNVKQNILVNHGHSPGGTCARSLSVVAGTANHCSGMFTGMRKSWAGTTMSLYSTAASTP